jgi:MFS family permease
MASAARSIRPRSPGEQVKRVPGRHALESLNFFMADMQSGIGPFIGVFLLAHGWQSGWIGTVMTVGSIAGVLMTAPAGAWVDSSHQKRWLVVIPGFCSIAASAIILIWQSFWPVAISQVATAIAGAAVGPAVNGITLGMFKQAGFNRQLGINQAYNHAGNAVGAGLSGYLGWKLGLPAVLWLALAFGAASVASALAIPKGSIDDRAARGMRDGSKADERAHGISILFKCKPLLILAAALGLFHLGNGAMLPLYGMAIVSAKQGDPAAVVAATIVVAQTTMVLAALVAMRMSANRGLWLVLFISFLTLPLRGFIAATFIKSWGVFPVQILDGIGAGLQSVAVPALVAHILNGTGRINVGQGAAMTVQGAGAALSPAIGGWIAQTHGYGAAFIALGLFALGAIVLWLSFANLYKPAIAQTSRLKRLARPKPHRAT